MGMDYKSADDFLLMSAVRDSDDHQAFAEIVRRYQNILLNYFIRSAVEYDMEDLVQQTFLRLYRYRRNYRPSAKFTTYLFLMARQVWIDELRKRQRRQKLADELEQQTEPFAAGPAPEEVADARHDVAQAMRSLPDKLRQVVELGVYQELPYAEVSKILGIPVGTVKSRMFNALAKLKDFLLKDQGGKT